MMKGSVPVLFFVISAILVASGAHKNGQSSRTIVGIRPIVSSSREGGSKGKPFADKLGTLPGEIDSEAVIIGVDSIDVSLDTLVESIQVTYRLSNGSLYSAPRHGETRYKPVTITLAPDEFIEKIEGITLLASWETLVSI